MNYSNLPSFNLTITLEFDIGVRLHLAFTAHLVDSSIDEIKLPNGSILSVVAAYCPVHQFADFVLTACNEV